MSPTPSPELEGRLRAAMRPGAADLEVTPGFADQVVARAARSRRRRRTAYAAAVPVLVAALTAGVIVVTNEVVDTNSAPVDKPIEEPVRPTVPLDRWLPHHPIDPSKPASAGTSMYRSCADDDCAVTLVSPSGREIDLADVHPALGERLAEDGLDGVSLSPTGRWLGMPTDDGAYRIYSLATQSRPVTVPVSSDGDRWELVGWSEQSWAPTLALYDGDRLVRFANWDNLTRTPVRYVDVPDGVVTTPFLGHRNYYLSPVTGPIEPDDNGRMPRVAATTPPTNEWFVVHRLWGPYTAGKVVGDVPDWEEGQSFEDCVGADETLAAPNGRIYQWEVRGSRSVDADHLNVATAIFSRDPSRTEPVAIVQLGCRALEWQGESVGGRLDLPTSTASETWTFLGMLPDREVAMLRSVDGVRTYVRVRETGQLDPVHDLPADAQVITPGGLTGE